MLDDLLGRVDVVVDCTPKKVGAQNRPRRRTA
jgi:glyceraldehyde-3-phosphate dehydrogenase/erythrose-4-phosphate dehydrogenase